jgi:hypothetical protein
MNLAKKAMPGGQSNYREVLFADSRLDLRFALFENITVPSLRPNLQHPDAHLLVLASKAMPEKLAIRLENSLSGIKNSTIRYCDPILSVDGEAGTAIRELLAKKGVAKEEKGAVATVRLDDDDALSRNFCQLLDPYVRPELSEFWVSFPVGVRMSIEGTRVVLTKAYLPKTSQGLSRIVSLGDFLTSDFGTAYGLGGHARVDTRAPVILDGRHVAYVRTNHKDNDSGMRRLEAARHWIQVSAEPDIMLDEFKENFDLDPTSIGYLSRKSIVQRRVARLSLLIYQRA